MLGRISRLQNFFAGVALGALICVGIIAFQMLTLPRDDYGPRSIVIGSPDALGPADGRAVLTGSVDVGETAQFNEDLILVKRTFYFAPIRSGPTDKSPLKYFVQVRRDDARGKGRFNPIVFPQGDDKVRAWRFRVRDIAIHARIWTASCSAARCRARSPIYTAMRDTMWIGTIMSCSRRTSQSGGGCRCWRANS